MNGLPEGFTYIPADKKASLTFDLSLNRFYLSKDLFTSQGLTKGQRIGIAYNSHTKQALIDKNGRAFYIDRRGYVTSKRFTEEVRTKGGHKSSEKVYYGINDELKSDRFIVFDEVNVR